MNVAPVAALPTPLRADTTDSGVSSGTEVEHGVALEFAALLAGLLRTPPPAVSTVATPSSSSEEGGGSSPANGATGSLTSGDAPAVTADGIRPVAPNVTPEKTVIPPGPAPVEGVVLPPPVDGTTGEQVIASTDAGSGNAASRPAPVILEGESIPEAATPQVLASLVSPQDDLVVGPEVIPLEALPTVEQAPTTGVIAPEKVTHAAVGVSPREGGKAMVASFAEAIIALVGRVTGTTPAPPVDGRTKVASHSPDPEPVATADDTRPVGNVTHRRVEDAHAVPASTWGRTHHPSGEGTGGGNDGAATDQRKRESLGVTGGAPLVRGESEASRAAAVDLSRLAGSSQATPPSNGPSLGTMSPSVAPSPAAPPDPPRAPDAPQVVTIRFDAPGGGESRIRVSVRGDVVQATILTDAQTAPQLERALPELQRSLADRGFSESRVSVRVVAADQSPMGSFRPELASGDPSRQRDAQYRQAPQRDYAGDDRPRGKQPQNDEEGFR